MAIELQHLPADTLGLTPFSRALLEQGGKAFGVTALLATSDCPPPENPFDRDERAQLVERLERSLAPFEPHVAVADSVRKLAEPESSIVLTIVRPSLFCGPLACWYRALQAGRVARTLEARWKRPVVPMLWLDTDAALDANDLSGLFLDDHFHLQRFAIEEHAHQRASSLVLSDAEHHLPSVRAALRNLLHGSPQRDRACDLFFPEPRRTLADQTVRTFLALTGATGLVPCTPDWLRADVSHFLANVVSTEPGRLLQASCDELAAAGFALPEGLAAPALVQRLTHEGRLALRPGGDGFRYDDEPGSRTAAELAAEIVQAPAEFVADSLLLPVVLESALPLAARVAPLEEGLLEAARTRIRRAAHGPDVPWIPAVSVTLLDQGTLTALGRLSRDVRSVLEARGRLAAPRGDRDPRSAIQELRDYSRDVARGFRDRARELDEFDPSLVPVSRRISGELREAIERYCEKADRVAANRSGKLDRHARRTNHGLFPDGVPQAEAFGPLAVVARHGTDWLEELGRDLEPFGLEHVVCVLDT